MGKRKWMIWLGSSLLIVLAITGYIAVSAEVGSKEDPLVALSYINDVLLPNLTADIDKEFEARKAELDAQISTRIQSFGSELDSKVSQYQASIAAGTVSEDVIDAIAELVLQKMQAEGVGGSAQSTGSESNWQVIKLDAGKKLIAEVGCEILLRIGSATCVASGTPGLINLSAGSDLAGGGALVTNNLYIVTVNGRGISSAAGCTILVNGKYTIS